MGEKTESDEKKERLLPKGEITGRPIFTWICQHCGWANDNNNGPCHKCKRDD